VLGLIAKLREIAARVKGLFTKPRRDAELTDEVSAHLDLLADEFVRRGIPRDEAHDAAKREFGGVEQMEEIYRERRGLPMLETFVQDVRFGARMLRKNPTFTAVAILTLALGIGANSAFFSFLNGILLRTLPYSQPDRIVTMWQTSMPKGGLLALQERMKSMEIAGYSYENGYNITGRDEPIRVTGSIVSANLFPMLGVTAASGRIFRTEEQNRAQSHVIILSSALWERLYGKDSDPIGKSLTLEGTAFQVVGVMPAGFHFPSDKAQFWIPLTVDVGNQYMWGSFGYLPLGRLRPGVTLEQARAEYKSLVPQIVKLFPWTMPTHYVEWTQLDQLQESMVSGLRTKLFLLLGAVGLVLLIACANVANLLLTRAAARQKEFTVRAALGAGRLRLVRQLLTECLLVAFCGGALGLLLARAALVMLKAVLPADTPRMAEVSLDWRVMLFTAGLILVTGIIFGLAPAWRATRGDLEQTLRGSSQKSAGRGRRRLSSALVISEAALMVVLMVGAGLLLKSLWRLAHVQTGIHADNVITALITPNGSVCARGDQCVTLFNDIRSRVAAMPGVQSAALADNTPFSGVFPSVLAVEDRPEYSSANPFSAWSFTASPNLLRTLGVPLLEGRDFADTDRVGSAGVVMVSRSLADKLWPGQDPIGRHVKPSWLKEWRTVVGVVADVREYSLFPEGAQGRVVGDVYYPAAQGMIFPPGSIRLVLRVAGDPKSADSELRSAVNSVRSDVPISEVRTMDEILSLSIAAPRSTSSLFTLFALLALTLGGVGIYSVVSYSVAERTQEIGIRVAIGAQRGDVLKMVIGDGMKLAAIGMVIGVAAAAGLTRLMESLLYEVRPTDTATYLGVLALLASLAAIACYIPARRATRVDPTVALRYE
jgi:putative ABC transport system permease protein